MSSFLIKVLVEKSSVICLVRIARAAHEEAESEFKEEDEVEAEEKSEVEATGKSKLKRRKPEEKSELKQRRGRG